MALSPRSVCSRIGLKLCATKETRKSAKTMPKAHFLMGEVAVSY